MRLRTISNKCGACIRKAARRDCPETDRHSAATCTNQFLAMYNVSELFGKPWRTPFTIADMEDGVVDDEADDDAKREHFRARRVEVTARIAPEFHGYGLSGRLASCC